MKLIWTTLAIFGTVFGGCLGPENVIANAPVYFKTCEGDWTLQTTVFRWHAHQDGLEFALKDAVPVFIINPYISELQELNQPIAVEYVKPNSKWQYGLKLGLGYHSPNDGWDLGVVWTNYRCLSKNHLRTNVESDTLIVLWSAFTPAQGLPLYAREVEAHWKVKLNLIDLSLGREFWTSKWLTLRPHIGFRYARIEQKYDLIHKGGSWSPRTGPMQDPYTNYVDLNNNFTGAGLRSGLDTQWHWGCGFGFYGNLAASIVYGRFRIRHNEKNRLLATPYTHVPILSLKDRFRASRAILDLAFGLQWTRQFCECTYGITTQLGWEAHLFLNQNQLWKVNRSNALQGALPNNTGQNIFNQSRGSLDTQGWTLRFQFEF